MNSFAEFNRYTNSPVANYKGKLCNLPFQYEYILPNMGNDNAEDVRQNIEHQKEEYECIGAI